MKLKDLTIIFLSLIFSTVCLAVEREYDATGYPITLPDDPRLVRSSTSPEWLAAVGRHVVHKDRGTKRSTKQCTVELVADQIGKDGIIIIGAGHCASQMYQMIMSDPNPEAYGNCSTPIKIEQHFREDVGSWTTSDCWEMRTHPLDSITFWTSSGEKITRQIEVVFDYEAFAGDGGDYFIARLDKSIPYSKIKPLLNSPFDYTDMLDGFPFPAFATMAGFSADTVLGQMGEVMTYHERCKLTGGGDGRKYSYCYSYEGGSGGPVTVTIDFGSLKTDWVDDCDCMSTDEYFEFFTDTFPNLEWKTYTFWVGSIFGGFITDTFNNTLWTDSSHHTQKLDKILADH